MQSAEKFCHNFDMTEGIFYALLQHKKHKIEHQTKKREQDETYLEAESVGYAVSRRKLGSKGRDGKGLFRSVGYVFGQWQTL